jgi:peptidoglycan/xylan/chitin deacetylase (PgdA/CDA1 family)
LTLMLALSACSVVSTAGAPVRAGDTNTNAPVAIGKAAAPSPPVSPVLSADSLKLAARGPAIAVPSPTSIPAAASAPTKASPMTVVPILMYHYVRELPANTKDQLGFGLSVSPKLFEQQLNYLAGASYTSVTMDQVSSHIASGAPLPPKPVVLSFDDGYGDFYTTAWPLLRKYHFSATVYLVVDFLGRPGYMSWQQAQDLKQAGVEIGAHTLDHVDLAIQQPAQAQRQISDSGAILRQRLGAPVKTFAYPSGRYTAATIKLVGAAGFTSAVTTAFGERHTSGDLLTLTRVRVPGGISLPSFIKNLSS